MLTLRIQVPEARDRTALAALNRDTKELAKDFAAASASKKIATARGNPQCDPLRAWGHPPTGAYRLINHQRAGKDRAGEYGMHILLFEPLSGVALQAQSAGRVGLLVYGGPAGQDKNMRCTQGGVRLSNSMLGALAGQLGNSVQDMPDVTLVIEALRKPAWWKFWARTPASPPLSSTALKPLSAPLDEMSIILKLMDGALRRVSGGGSSMNDDRRTRDDDRNDDRSSSSSNSSPDSFRGGGGQSAGAGASGSWDSAPGTARGVDASGRIIAGAAAGVAAAAIVASAASAREGDSASGFTDSGAADGGADGIVSGSFSNRESSGTHTSTSTSY